VARNLYETFPYPAIQTLLYARRNRNIRYRPIASQQLAIAERYID